MKRPTRQNDLEELEMELRTATRKALDTNIDLVKSDVQLGKTWCYCEQWIEGATRPTLISFARGSLTAHTIRIHCDQLHPHAVSIVGSELVAWCLQKGVPWPV